jgi:hypothetical protein
MANRSYIYGLKGDKHSSIGEFPYHIPYAFRILAAYENTVVDSHLFDKFIGIQADFQKGKEALYRLLDLLTATEQMKDHAEFVSAVKKTKDFLDAIDAEHILLENGEIYALYTKDGNYLDGEGLEKANQYACKDYQWIGEDLQNLETYRLDPKNLFVTEDETLKDLYGWLIGLKDTWQEELGLDAWSNILYFQFKAGDSPA